jgi:hypothetical protein
VVRQFIVIGLGHGGRHQAQRVRRGTSHLGWPAHRDERVSLAPVARERKRPLGAKNGHGPIAMPRTTRKLLERPRDGIREHR